MNKQRFLKLIKYLEFKAEHSIPLTHFEIKFIKSLLEEQTSIRSNP